MAPKCIHPKKRPPNAADYRIKENTCVAAVVSRKKRSRRSQAYQLFFSLGQDIEQTLLAFVDLVQDLPVVLLQQLVGELVLLGEEVVEVVGFPRQLPLDIIGHAGDCYYR